MFSVSVSIVCRESLNDLARHTVLLVFTFLCRVHVCVCMCVVFCLFVFVCVCRLQWCHVQCCVCPPASLGRLHSCITFHLSSLLDRVSAASSFSRAGPGAVPRGQQLIGLRKALYRALRSAFRASRRATCHMLKAYPLPVENNSITGSSHCYGLLCSDWIWLHM